MATAYAGLAFLAISLWLGPWNVLRRRPNPVSFDLRRDVGIWAVVLAIVHTVVVSSRALLTGANRISAEMGGLVL